MSDLGHPGVPSCCSQWGAADDLHHGDAEDREAMNAHADVCGSRVVMGGSPGRSPFIAAVRLRAELIVRR